MTANGNTYGDAIAILPVAKIVLDKDWGPRTRFTEIDSLAASIAKDGQIEPGIVQRIAGTDTYKLIEGTRRLMACKKAGVASFRAQIVPETADVGNLRWANVLVNIHRVGYRGYETAKVLADYAARTKLAKHGRGAEISKRFGVSEDGEKLRMSASYVNNMLRAFEGLTESCLKAWSEGKLVDDVAWKLAARTKEDQDKLLSQAKNASLASFLESLDAFDNPDPQGGEAGDKDKNDPDNKKSKPGKAALKKALVWATKQEQEEAVVVLKWVLGARKTLELGGVTFDPKAKPADAESK